MDRLAILRSELQNDPLGRGYAGMTPEQAAASLNTVNREVDREVVGRNVIPSHRAIAALVAADYLALTDGQQRLFALLVSAGFIDVANTGMRALFTALFPSGTTRDNLIDLLTVMVSRAEELGLPHIEPGHVEQALEGTT